MELHFNENNISSSLHLYIRNFYIHTVGISKHAPTTDLINMARHATQYSVDYKATKKSFLVSDIPWNKIIRQTKQITHFPQASKTKQFRKMSCTLVFFRLVSSIALNMFWLSFKGERLFVSYWLRSSLSFNMYRSLCIKDISYASSAYCYDKNSNPKQSVYL